MQPEEVRKKDAPLSVTEVTRALQDLIRNSFPGLTVEGEISDFTHYRSSGHMYFSLSDEESTLPAVMFRRANQALDFDPEEGMQVVVEGHLDVYVPRGQYQIIVEQMRPAGRGELEREFEELKRKLEKEGALKADRKRPLPELPGTIGVVTSGDGAAFWDIVRTVRNRCPVVRVVLYPCRVNGKESGEEIARAIRRLPELVDIDCMIVGRGGGSPEDLWGFNTEPVARAILDCPVPVISAVGHEVDVTIADLVADHRSPTPTAAGEDVVPSREELLRLLGDHRRRLRSAYRHPLERRRDQIRFLAEKPVFQSPESMLEVHREQFRTVRDRFRRGVEAALGRSVDRFERVRQRLRALDPRSVLNRGYTLVEDGDGRVLPSVEEVESGDRILVRWSDGTADATVDGTQSDDS